MFRFLALLLVAACTTLRPVEPAQLTGSHPPDSVRVTRTDRSVMVLDAPRLVGDTLVGTLRSLGRDVPERLPLSQVATMQVREAAPVRTAALLIGGAAATGALTYFVIESVNPGTAMTPCGICVAVSMPAFLASSVGSSGAQEVTCCNNPLTAYR